MTASSRAVRNAALLLTAEVVGKVSTFAFTVVAARELSPADFGAFNYALAFAVLVATIPSWGFNPVVVREGSIDPERLPTLYSEALAWRTLLLVPTFAVAGVVGVATRPTDRASTALALVLLATAFDLLSDTGKAAAAVRGRLHGWAFGLVANRLLSAVAAVVLLAAGTGLVGAAAGYLGGSVLGAVVTTVSITRLGVRPSLARVHWPGLRALGRQSVPLGLDALVAMTVSRVDTVILAGIEGDAAVAVYSVAYRLLETVLVVCWSLNTVVFPRLSAAGADEARHQTERAVAAVAAAYVPFGLVLLVRGPEVVGLVFGAVYEQPAAGTVRWLSGAALAFAVGFFASAALVARRRNGRALAASVVAAVANVALNLALIPEYGPAGAAFATLATYGLEAVVLVAFCVPVLGWLRLDRAVLVPAVAGLPLVAALLLVPGGVVAQVLAGGALYAVSWLLLARRLAPDAVALLRGAVRGRVSG